MKSIYDDGWLLQQDNMSLHTSKKTRHFLKNKAIALLGLPSKSLDLNVIGNCWHIPAQHIYVNGVTNNLTYLRRKINETICTINRQPNTGLNICRFFHQEY